MQDLETGAVSRRQFIARATALGLSVPTIAGLLAACGDDGGGSTAGGSTAGGGTAISSSGGARGAEAVAAKVYPDGITSDPEYKGPNGGSRVAFLPPDAYDGTDEHGIRRWVCYDFTADKPYRIAFAHFSAKWDLSVEMAARAERAIKAMGCEPLIFDNNFDADQAIKNVDLIVQQQADFVVEAQIFPDANKAIYKRLEAAGIPSGYFAVEGPDGALFEDAGNLRMCTALGEWLGEYARDNWDGQVDLVMLAAQPRAGAYVAEREVGYRAGIKKVLPDLPDSVFVEFDSQGLLDESQKKAADVLTAHPDAKTILGCGSNDDAAVGIVRALEAAKRADTAAVAGQAGQASAVEELKKPDSPFKVSAFTDIETVPWLAAIGILELMGGEVAPVNFLPFYLITSDNVGDFPPQAGTLA
ncbi:MAG: substrate-binding domain-containing protein [Solirubrobacteraceae bacterium]|nr:substrate-binding domain-containing protein [Solirubrobacteraceae bacterium]